MLLPRFQLDPIKPDTGLLTRDRWLRLIALIRLTVAAHIPATRDTTARNDRPNAARSVWVIGCCAIVFTIAPSLKDEC